MHIVELMSVARLPMVRYFSTSPNLAKVKEQYSTVDRIIRNKGNYKIYPHKIMYKLLFREKKKNPFIIYNHVGAPSISVKTAVDVVSSSRVVDSKRVRVLNKLLMRYIPELLATSDIGADLWDHDVQICRIKMSQHFQLIDVFWVPTGTEEDEKVQKILNQAAHPLRQELISLRIMGLVPEIRFKKDPHRTILLEIDRRLRIADYGEDYVPVNVFKENNLKSQLQLIMPFSDELRSKISFLEDSEQFSKEEEREIPPMQNNVFGLYHDKIMNAITTSMKHVKLVDRTPPLATESLLGESAIKEVPFNFEAQQRENWSKAAFLNYLKKQKTKRRQIIRAENREYKEQLAKGNFPAGNEEIFEDEEYEEFVKNVFPDELEDISETEAFDRYEDEV